VTGAIKPTIVQRSIYIILSNLSSHQW